MKRYDSPSFCCRSIIRLTIWAWIETSKADTGSSHRINFGRTANARAMPIRCRWPPLNSCGYRLMNRAFNPTSSISRNTSSSRSRPRANR